MEERVVDCCPLCKNEGLNHYHSDKNREYLQCNICMLVFVPHHFWLNPQEEKAIYDLHKNDPADQGYRTFLSRLTLPLLQQLQCNCSGLDFGCGPGPTLSLMLEEQGHTVALFDPFYHDDYEVLAQKYDFICATEVIEHLRAPSVEFERLFSILKPGGWLGLMTKMVRDEQAFCNWHYIRDLTHICFFSRYTFQYLARRFQSELFFIGSDVILFQKR
jgi:2-polyprenyl-3-methyl-5-hydroxy-6-metoxy-1,4-benzoquinol methylase